MPGPNERSGISTTKETNVETTPQVTSVKQRAQTLNSLNQNRTNNQTKHSFQKPVASSVTTSPICHKLETTPPVKSTSGATLPIKSVSTATDKVKPGKSEQVTTSQVKSEPITIPTKKAESPVKTTFSSTERMTTIFQNTTRYPIKKDNNNNNSNNNNDTPGMTKKYKRLTRAPQLQEPQARLPVEEVSKETNNVLENENKAMLQFEKDFEEHQKLVLQLAKQSAQVKESLKRYKEILLEEHKKVVQKKVNLMQRKVEWEFKLRAKEKEINNFREELYKQQLNLLEHHMSENISEYVTCVQILLDDILDYLKTHSAPEVALKTLRTLSSYMEAIQKKLEQKSNASPTSKDQYATHLNVILKSRLEIEKTILSLVNNNKSQTSLQTLKLSSSLSNSSDNLFDISPEQKEELDQTEKRIQESEEDVLKHIDEKNKKQAHQSFHNLKKPSLEKIKDCLKKEEKVFNELYLKEVKIAQQKQVLILKQRVLECKQMDALESFLTERSVDNDGFVDTLMKFNFAPNAKNTKNETLLHLYLKKDLHLLDLTTAKLLISEVNALIKNKDGKTARELFEKKNEFLDKNSRQIFDELLSELKANEEKMKKLPQETKAEIDEKTKALTLSIRTRLSKEKGFTKDIELKLHDEVKETIQTIINTLSDQLLEEDRINFETHLKTQEDQIKNSISIIYKDYKNKAVAEEILEKLLPIPTKRKNSLNNKLTNMFTGVKKSVVNIQETQVPQTKEKRFSPISN